MHGHMSEAIVLGITRHEIKNTMRHSPWSVRSPSDCAAPRSCSEPVRSVSLVRTVHLASCTDNTALWSTDKSPGPCCGYLWWSWGRAYRRDSQRTTACPVDSTSQWWHPETLWRTRGGVRWSNTMWRGITMRHMYQGIQMIYYYTLGTCVIMKSGQQED